MRIPATTRGRVLVALGMAAVAVFFLTTVPFHRNWFDLHVYYGAVEHWIGGAPIYDYLRPGTHYGFTYPPFAALCMLPMTLVGWHSALAISQLLNIAAAAVVLHVCLDATIRRESRHRWFAYTAAACMLALLEPVRDTVSFGQVNLLLLALVLVDCRLLTAGHERFPSLGRLAGLGIGLAAAIKLTPAIFICYLLVTRRWRAAGVAIGTASGATLLAAWAAPTASRTFWTEAMWNTDRVGSLAYVSNQSWQGMLARLTEPFAEPSRAVWAVGVVLLLWLWARRARQAAVAGDELAGFALTGAAACLVSPVTWVHHLVWLIPALAVLADKGLRSDPGGRRRRRLLTWALVGYAVLCSSMVWLWRWNDGGAPGFLGANAYVWMALLLLLLLPLGGPGTDRDGPYAESGPSATMGACAHATASLSRSVPVSRLSEQPPSPTRPGSKPAPSGSGG